MSSDRIASIDKHLEVLRARRMQLIARAAKEERRARLRRAIIVGNWILTRKPELAQAIAANLSRPQDRRAFGLPERFSAGESGSEKE